ncbi:MAG TPA: alanine--tRNA ligase, partial [Dehalococcoidales bacterium]|nr:alanine--tRNA ligase [Dehalococcoidales bacterium]
MVNSDEIRTAYLKFFEERGHKIIRSDSLIPKGDPTLLLTSAGMVQFKSYFLGEAVPPNPRMVSCQKCFRTTDIESVGDASHLTFFEMLGNFSVGDYFKKEAINWAWEFVTKDLKLLPERLWASIFLDDDESFGYWQEAGVPASRILRFGEKDNFWGPAGKTGPCGPCSEIHYDFGEDVGCGKPTCAPNCECGRFSEIWNLVFTQFFQDEEGKRTPLPKRNIDTGMGLERTLAAVTGKTSVYETELFAPLMECIAELSGKKYGSDDELDMAMRVVAEHGRGVTFLVGDGVIPSNEGRGYVLRRILRRAALFGRRLGLDKPFLTEMAKTSIEQMGHVYPEIKQRQDFILNVIELEESRFEETLSTGLELLDGMMAGLASKGKSEISGKQVFKLYDTYGFPVASTTEIARERGFSIDTAGFEKEMEKQRERAKASHKFELAEKVKVKEGLNIKETFFV